MGSFHGRDACHACTRNSSARKATLNTRSAWTQGSSNPRKQDLPGEQVGAASAWIRRISSVPTTAVPNARASATGYRPSGAVGSQGEPGEAEPDQADAPQDDRAVHEGFEVVASVEPFQEESDDSTNRGADQRRPRRPRSAEEKDCSHSQAAEHPLSQELLGTAREVHRDVHQSDGSTSMRP
jgi:hypothetical protein